MYQLGVVLGGMFFSAFAMLVLDAFLDVVQTRVLAIARDQGREPSAEDIASIATTQCIKHVFVLLFAGGLCLGLELHRWDDLLSPIVLVAIFGRNLFLLFDAASCRFARTRLPRGLPKSVMPR